MACHRDWSILKNKFACSKWGIIVLVGAIQDNQIGIESKKDDPDACYGEGYYGSERQSDSRND